MQPAWLNRELSRERSHLLTFQVAATMCYAVVTTGEDWQFGKFDKKNTLFIKQLNKISVLDDNDEPSNLQKLFDALNWLFDKASQVKII